MASTGPSGGLPISGGGPAGSSSAGNDTTGGGGPAEKNLERWGVEYPTHTRQVGTHQIGTKGSITYISKNGKITPEGISVDGAAQIAQGYNVNGSNQPAARNLAVVLLSYKEAAGVGRGQITSAMMASVPGLKGYLDTAIAAHHENHEGLRAKQAITYLLINGLSNKP